VTLDEVEAAHRLAHYQDVRDQAVAERRVRDRCRPVPGLHADDVTVSSPNREKATPAVVSNHP
jgi:hypothetical protein